jgi:4-amino-4-deoxy-L-arabinose transferase and related glycosyltransferases of PMT family
VAILAVFILYFYGIWRVGLLDPDEPRYASIGREMALSGDWITPRLWGSPWFEKPALLYWLIGLAYKAGLNDDLAPRLPVALVSAAFLLFFFLRMRREFGERPAWFAAAILATSAGWIAFGQVAATDAPMSAAFAASMLLCLPWLRTGDRRRLLPAGVLLGLAVLAKGLVPLALAAPLLWAGRKRWTDLFRLGVGCLLVALPWYALCTMRNGTVFLSDFFLRHHFARFVAADELLHGQPFWFYVPVLLGALYPWSFVLPVILRKESDPRRVLLLLWLLFGFVLFSLSANKLPGYVLPLLPAAAALLGLRLAEMPDVRWALAITGLLLGCIPLIGGMLPDALLSGLSRVPLARLEWWPFFLGTGIAAACWFIPKEWAMALIVLGVAAGVLYLKIAMFPRLDEIKSARPLWLQVAGRRSETCVGPISRAWRYGLNFYSVTPLPDCESGRYPVRIVPGNANHPTIKIW